MDRANVQKNRDSCITLQCSSNVELTCPRIVRDKMEHILKRFLSLRCSTGRAQRLRLLSSYLWVPGCLLAGGCRGLVRNPGLREGHFILGMKAISRRINDGRRDKN